MRRPISGFIVSLLLLLGLTVVPSAASAITVPGDDRIADTTDPVLASVQISQEFIAGKGDVEAVVLGRSDLFPDNLGGASLAGASEGVMLLTDGGPRAQLRAEVRAEINRVLTPSPANLACNDVTANVYILGGTSAVSSSVESTLKADGWCVIRLGGTNRIATALLVADTVRKLTGDFDFAMVARSDNPVDSASAGALGSSQGIPIVLTATNLLAPAVDDFLFKGGNATKFDVFMLGGTAALSSGVENALIKGANAAPGNVLVDRVAGSARDTTAVEIGKLYQTFNPSGVSVVIVNGYRDDTWVYALTAGALAWRENIVVLYVRQERVDTPTCDFIDSVNPPAIKVLGPTSVVSKAAFDEAIACAGGGGGGGGGTAPQTFPAIPSSNYNVKMTGGVAGQPPIYSQTFNTRLDITASPSGQVTGTLGQTDNSCACSLTFDGQVGTPGDGLISLFSPNNKGEIFVLNMTITQSGTKWRITGDYYMNGPGNNNVANPHAGDAIDFGPNVPPPITAQAMVSDFGTIVINQP